MRSISELQMIDYTAWDEAGETVIYENHFKRRKLFGIVIFQKRYRAMTSKDKRSKKLGYGKN